MIYKLRIPVEVTYDDGRGVWRNDCAIVHVEAPDATQAVTLLGEMLDELVVKTAVTSRGRRR